jgi:hypothetical protein
VSDQATDLSREFMSDITPDTSGSPSGRAVTAVKELSRARKAFSTRELRTAAVALAAGPGIALAAAVPAHANSLLPNRVVYFQGCISPGGGAGGLRRVPSSISNYGAARSTCGSVPIPGWIRLRLMRWSDDVKLFSHVGYSSTRSGPHDLHEDVAVDDQEWNIKSLDTHSHLMSGVSRRTFAGS